MTIPLFLTACKNEGTKVGLTFQDCAFITANERMDFAKATENMNRADAVNFVATQKNITVEEAGTCFK